MMPVPRSVHELGRARARLDHVLFERNHAVESGSVEGILAAESRTRSGPSTLTLAQAQAEISTVAPLEISRQSLVIAALHIIHYDGPQSTAQLLERFFGDRLSPDDRRILNQRLPKWLLAECRHQNPPLSIRRERSPEGGEKRYNLFGFWPDPSPLQSRTRARLEVAEVMTDLAGIRDELASLRAVQQEILQFQRGLREGMAYALEKLT